MFFVGKRIGKRWHFSLAKIFASNAIWPLTFIENSCLDHERRFLSFRQPPKCHKLMSGEELNWEENSWVCLTWRMTEELLDIGKEDPTFVPNMEPKWFLDLPAMRDVTKEFGRLFREWQKSCWVLGKKIPRSYPTFFKWGKESLFVRRMTNILRLDKKLDEGRFLEGFYREDDWRIVGNRKRRPHVRFQLGAEEDSGSTSYERHCQVRKIASRRSSHVRRLHIRWEDHRSNAVWTSMH